MKYINYEDIRVKIRLVFQSYLFFALFEVYTGVKALYEFTTSVCIFSVTFKREELVFVEKFYEHLNQSFRDMEIAGWSQFQQLYDYDVEAYVTY